MAAASLVPALRATSRLPCWPGVLLRRLRPNIQRRFDVRFGTSCPLKAWQAIPSSPPKPHPLSWHPLARSSCHIARVDEGTGVAHDRCQQSSPSRGFRRAGGRDHRRKYRQSAHPPDPRAGLVGVGGVFVLLRPLLLLLLLRLSCIIIGITTAITYNCNFFLLLLLLLLIIITTKTTTIMNAATIYLLLRRRRLLLLFLLHIVIMSNLSY